MIASAVLAAYGLANCFGGYKLAKLLVILSGAAAGFLAGIIVLVNNPGWLAAGWLRALFLTGMAVAAALICRYAYRLGVFVWIGLLGYLDLGNLPCFSDYPLPLLAAAAIGIAVTLCALRHARRALTAASAILGGALAALSALYLYSSAGGTASWLTLKAPAAATVYWWALAGGAVLGLAGLLVQLKSTKYSD